ncbi:MAG: hypothetical protein M3O36_12670 [Myxococcota bacterium]|nr:hypothetical protein [Myxococcota bacterium]
MRFPIRTVALDVAVALRLLLPIPAHAADPTTADCLGANNSAIDLRNDHRLRAARSQLLLCAAASCPAEIRKECLRRLDEVNAQIPTITFEARDASGKDLSAVQVTMDGRALAERLEGVALALDPGEHTFTFETSGQTPLQKQLVVQEAQKSRRESVTFGEPKRIEPFGRLPAPPPPEGFGTRQILAIVAGGAGVVGLGVGSVFGLMAKSKGKEAATACPNDCADQNGVNLWNDAKTTARISDFAFILGGAGLAGEVALWLTTKPQSGSGPRARVGLGPSSLQLNGVW